MFNSLDITKPSIMVFIIISAIFLIALLQEFCYRGKRKVTLNLRKIENNDEFIKNSLVNKGRNIFAIIVNEMNNLLFSILDAGVCNYASEVSFLEKQEHQHM